MHAARATQGLIPRYPLGRALTPYAERCQALADSAAISRAVMAGTAGPPGVAVVLRELNNLGDLVSHPRRAALNETRRQVGGELEPLELDDATTDERGVAHTDHMGLEVGRPCRGAIQPGDNDPVGVHLVPESGRNVWVVIEIAFSEVRGSFGRRVHTDHLVTAGHREAGAGQPGAAAKNCSEN